MRIQGRYEVRGVIGEGGMGIVYRAEDLKLRTEVAVKTIRDPHDAACFELFKKECAVLTSLNHANIVDIRDVGEYEDQGVTRPYLVMPLLPGVTLDKIIEKQPGRLTPERVVDMMLQACRGLQAAHDARLIHRDLKPSNLFVFDDDSVKIIDFGIAHLVDQRSTVGAKGTPHYMSPEQITGGRLTPESDLFSLGVICFECLTRRRPFAAGTRDEVFQNILRATPPAISDLNSAVPQLLSQVIHLAMAKQPVYRYRSAREFAECLQKGVRNESIERFDPVSIAPRLTRVRHALESSEYEDAQDLLDSIEAEGYLHPEIPSLRKQATMALRNRRIGLLLESSKRLFEKSEYRLVMEKLQKVLDESPAHPEALRLMAEAEGKQQVDQYNKWVRLAEEHLENFSFAQAREAARHAQEMETTDRVLQLLSKIEAKERDYQRVRKEKEELYQSALEHQRVGNLTQAAEKLEKLVLINNRAPEKTSPDRGAAYEQLFNVVKSERDTMEAARAEAYKLLQGKEYEAAIAICDRFLQKYPRHALLRNLRLEISERKQQDLSEYIAKVDRAAQEQPDLDRRVELYEEALRRFPGEGHLTRNLNMSQERRDAMRTHVAEARNKEERGQYAEALSHWETLKTLYPRFPGLDLEMERVRRRRDDQTQEEDRVAVVMELRRQLAVDELEAAVELAAEAQLERPDDPEIRLLSELARSRRVKSAQADKHLNAGLEAQGKHDLEGAIREFRQAFETGEDQIRAKARLVDALVARSRELADSEPQAAIQLSREALAIDDTNPKARAQIALLTDRGRDQITNAVLQRAGAARERGDIAAALKEVTAGLEESPDNERLTRFQQTLREADFEEVKTLRQSLRQAVNRVELNSIFAQIQQVTRRHGTDPRFEDLAKQAGTEKESLGLGMTALVKAAAAGAGAPLSPAPPTLPVLSARPTMARKPAPLPVAPAAAARYTKPVMVGAASCGVLLLVFGYFALKPSAPSVTTPARTPVVEAPIETPAPVATKPGLLINLIGGEVKLDGKVIAERNANYPLAPGTYRLELKDSANQDASANVVVNGDGGFEVRNLKINPSLLLTFVAVNKNKVTVFGPRSAGFGAKLENVPPDGLTLDIPADAGKFSVAHYSTPYPVPIQPAGDSPTLQAFVQDTSVGPLSVCKLPPGAEITLEAGSKRVPIKTLVDNEGCIAMAERIKIGPYLLRASAPGWLEKSEVIKVVCFPALKLNFPLVSAPIELQVSGAEPGSTLMVDQETRALADGTGVVSLPPGTRTIRLQRPGYEPFSESVVLEPGSRVKEWNAKGKQQRTPEKAPEPTVSTNTKKKDEAKPVATPTMARQDAGCLSSKGATDGGYVKYTAGRCGPFPGRFAFTARFRKGLLGTNPIEWRIGDGTNAIDFKLLRERITVTVRGAPKTDMQLDLKGAAEVAVACEVTEQQVRCMAGGTAIAPITPAFKLVDTWWSLKGEEHLKGVDTVLIRK